LKTTKGFILLHRTIKDNWIWDNDAYLKAWVDLLLSANHKAKKVYVNGQPIQCNRGETVKAIRTWARDWGWSRSRVSRFFKTLEGDHMIERKAIQKTTHLRIINYEDLQGFVRQTWDKDETSAPINNNVNKENNKRDSVKSVGKRSSKKEQLKKLSERLDEYQKKFPTLDIKYAFDYWKDSLSASGRVWTRYGPAFSNWCKAWAAAGKTKDQGWTYSDAPANDKGSRYAGPGKIKISAFKADITGHLIGYCSKCNESAFYTRWSVWDDSNCCKAKILPERKSAKVKAS
jgi:hypothetical protein|tara:strand:+ start:3956 stop:4819 length:864 start_codon:yes stop_codon:yes gene_type:complete